MPNIRRCAVLGCPSHSKRNPELSFFKFPSPDSPVYNKWKNACKASLARILPFKRAYICTTHFAPEMVTNRRLASSAVPSRNLDGGPQYNFHDYKLNNRKEAKSIYTKPEYINAVVFEWLIRAYTNPSLQGTITHGMIKGKAEEAKQMIVCEEFIVDNRWLTTFRQTYLKDFSSKIQRKALKPMGSSLEISDIVEQLRFKYQPAKIPNMEISASFNGTTEFDDNDSNEENDNDEDNENDEEDNQNHSAKENGNGHGIDDQEPMNDEEDNDNEDDDADSYIDVSQFAVVNEETSRSSSSPHHEREIETKHTNGEILITNYGQAIEYLKSLEDFVVANENFAAINLITKLISEFIKRDSRSQLK